MGNETANFILWRKIAKRCGLFPSVDNVAFTANAIRIGWLFAPLNIHMRFFECKGVWFSAGADVQNIYKLPKMFAFTIIKNISGFFCAGSSFSITLFYPSLEYFLFVSCWMQVFLRISFSGCWVYCVTFEMVSHHFAFLFFFLKKRLWFQKIQILFLFSTLLLHVLLYIVRVHTWMCCKNSTVNWDTYVDVCHNWSVSSSRQLFSKFLLPFFCVFCRNTVMYTRTLYNVTTDLVLVYRNEINFWYTLQWTPVPELWAQDGKRWSQKKYTGWDIT